MLRAPGLLQPVLQSAPGRPGPQARWAEQADIRSGSICRTQFRKVTLSKASLQSAALNRSAILGNSAVATGLEKVSFHSNPKERPCQGCANYCTVPFPSHASKVKLRILQLRLHQYVNQELPDVQAGFKKGRGTRHQIANIPWIIEKIREFQKNIYFCFTDYAKAFDCVDHSKLYIILQEMGIPDHLTCLLRNLYAGREATVRIRHGTTD